LHFSFNSKIDWLSFTLAAIFELTREVFLPDQSVRILRAAKKVGKRYLTKTLWKSVNACGRCAKQNGRLPSAIGVFRRPSPASRPASASRLYSSIPRVIIRRAPKSGGRKYAMAQNTNRKTCEPL
jgi:hypothetical protein